MTTLTPMTRRQADVLAAFKALEARTGRGATLAAVGKELGGMASPTVLEHVKHLERKGLLRKLATGGYGSAERCPKCGRAFDTPAALAAQETK